MYPITHHEWAIVELGPQENLLRSLDADHESVKSPWLDKSYAHLPVPMALEWVRHPLLVECLAAVPFSVAKT